MVGICAAGLRHPLFVERACVGPKPAAGALFDGQVVLAEIGEKNKITVTEEELNRAIMERVRQVPGREQEVWEYYRKNPGAVAAVRAPIFEEKVVDFLVELATVTEKQVSREDLLKDEEDEKSATAQS